MMLKSTKLLGTYKLSEKNSSFIHLIFKHKTSGTFLKSLQIFLIYNYSKF